MTSLTPDSKMDFTTSTESMWSYPPNDTCDEPIFETRYRKIAPILSYSQIVGERTASSVICLPLTEHEDDDDTWPMSTHKSSNAWDVPASMRKIWEPSYKVGLNPNNNSQTIMQDLKLLYDGDPNAGFLNKIRLRSLGFDEFVVTDKNLFLDPEEEETKKKKPLKTPSPNSRQQNPVREGIQAGQGWDTKMASEKQATYRQPHRIKVAPPAIQIPKYIDTGLSSASFSDMSLVSPRSNGTPIKDPNLKSPLYVRSASPLEVHPYSPIAFMTPSRNRSETHLHPQSIETYSGSSSGQLSPSAIRVRIPKIASTLLDCISDRSSQSPEYPRIDQSSQDVSMLGLSSRRNTPDTHSQASDGSNLSRQNEQQRIYSMESPTKRRDRVMNFMENYNRACAAIKVTGDHQTYAYKKAQLQLLRQELQQRAAENAQSRAEGLNTEHRLIQVPVIPISAQTTPHLRMFQAQNHIPQA